MMKRRAGGAVILAALTVLASCSSSDDASDSSESPAPAKVIEMTDQPGSVDGYVGALEDAEIKTCSGSGDGLDVAGTVTNPEQNVQDYRIYVSALDGSDTVGLVQINVTDVAGGDTAEWDTHMDLAQAELDCVLRVERFPSE